jgi:hypothetical protein
MLQGGERVSGSDGFKILTIQKIFYSLPTGGVRLGMRANAGRGF